ncbi:MAG: chorismate-binding protein, partial [Actinobacteria bacterium]|nr:chorismate-binding protein [Actinomycetota bacterium]
METYETARGVVVRRSVERIPVDGAIEPVLDALDSRRGAVLASSYEYPGRYTRWDMGFVDPPLVFTTRGRAFSVEALNERGAVLLGVFERSLHATDAVSAVTRDGVRIAGSVKEPEGRVPEEHRSRQPTVFSVVRAITDLFASDDEPHLGLYGAFGYDLVFQFEQLKLRLERDGQRDLVLYLPDELIVVDHRREVAERRIYDFKTPDGSTDGIGRTGASDPFVGATSVERDCDHAPGEYASVVEIARDSFHRGDLFEAVPSRTFFEPCPAPPSEIFRRLRERNPSPYGFLINLGRPPRSEAEGQS